MIRRRRTSHEVLFAVIVTARCSLHLEGLLHVDSSNICVDNGTVVGGVVCNIVVVVRATVCVATTAGMLGGVVQRANEAGEGPRREWFE